VKGDHVVVKKEEGAPKAKGWDHINGVVGFWSFFEELALPIQGNSDTASPSLP
jgi:hypothetical protein